MNHARPWFRFSLRTLFAVVTVVALVCGWLVHWQRQRAAVLAESVHLWAAPGIGQHSFVSGGSPPLLLKLLGAQGVSQLMLNSQVTDDELATIRRLFPEAGVTRMGDIPAESPLEN